MNTKPMNYDNAKITFGWDNFGTMKGKLIVLPMVLPQVLETECNA